MGYRLAGSLLELVADLLSYESNQTTPVALSVTHVGVDVDFVAISPDAAAQSGVHVLHAVEVACSDEYEVGWDRFGLGESSRGALGSTADGEFLLLHGDQQCLLLLHSEHTNLVDVQHALVGPVHSPWLDSLVSGGGEVGARLERIVANIAQKSSGQSSSGIHERRLVFTLVLNQQFRDVSIVACCQTGPEEEVSEDEDEGTEDECQYLTAGDGCKQQGGADYQNHEQQGAVGPLSLKSNLCLPL